MISNNNPKMVRDMLSDKDGKILVLERKIQELKKEIIELKKPKPAIVEGEDG